MASHRRPPSSGSGRAARITVLSAAATAVSAALSALPAGAQPGDPDATTHTAVDRFYRQAERATEKFNAATERADRLRDIVGRIQDRAARQQERVNRMRGTLGTLAGAQYRSGGVEPSVVLMLSEDPDGYLDKAAALERISRRQSGRLHALTSALRELRRQRAEAAGKLAQLADSRRDAARYKKTVQRRLAAARTLLNALPPQERAAYLARGGEPGPLDGLPGPVGAPGRATTALTAARGAVGAPYVWGQAGPAAFDCSGLTQWAYRRAGVAIPRTSQAQRFAGRSVPLSQARPGDLIIYRSDASHVAMYAGGGQVIHAPHPGARVRYDPVGMMPIASVTRP